MCIRDRDLGIPRILHIDLRRYELRGHLRAGGIARKIDAGKVQPQGVRPGGGKRTGICHGTHPGRIICFGRKGVVDVQDMVPLRGDLNAVAFHIRFVAPDICAPMKPKHHGQRPRRRRNGGNYVEHAFLTGGSITEAARDFDTRAKSGIVLWPYISTKAEYVP